MRKRKNGKWKHCMRRKKKIEIEIDGLFNNENKNKESFNWQ